ncbi:MAG: sensor histidine kinase [Sphingobacteriaceae bacterium]|jgi:signal transduction histidine kinase
MKRFKKPITIFYFLVLYALAELTWWGYLLIASNAKRMPMILGEGSVFLIILLVGIYFFQRTIKKESEFHQQQQNFLLSVTHELKSPLAAIKLVLQTLVKRDLTKDKRDQLIGNSIEDVGRLDDLVENMLLATRIENNSYSYPKELFDFSELVKSIFDRAIITSENTRNFQQLIEENISIMGDRFALGSLINNILENAIKYSPTGAAIQVQLYQQTNKVFFIVADQGVGIPTSERQKIFQKFYRSGNELTRKNKGTGLGLFIVAQVAKNHQAKVLVSNNQPKGTIFEIIFNLPQ